MTTAFPGAAPVADLSDNTNLFGVPPAAARALAGAADLAPRYPSPQADRLRAALAAYAGVPAECVVTGCGSDDVLDCAFRAFGAPGDRVAHAAPTFSMIPLLAEANRLRPRAVPLAPGGDHDADALLASGARIVYLCSPNNPTGGAASAGTLARVAERAPGLVVVDRAYAEFEAGGEAPALPVRAGVLEVRTLSKAFGLAGLRVGWGVSDPATVRALERVRGPYKVGSIAERAAVAALEEDRAWMAATARAALASRARLAAGLAALGRAPLPSQANFVLVPVPDAEACAAALARRGVRVRPFARLAGIGDAIRVTAGPDPAVAALLAALPAALEESAPRPPGAGARGGMP
uniref:Histidinol-phosphate aminotransferase family protein n=1 Tax=Eiseniibacteriota bacterium TaxID=2212470 RepID=A0A832MN16_UNCEI